VVRVRRGVGMFGMFQSLSTEDEFDLTLLLYSGDCLCRFAYLKMLKGDARGS